MLFNTMMNICDIKKKVHRRRFLKIENGTVYKVHCAGSRTIEGIIQIDRKTASLSVCCLKSIYLRCIEINDTHIDPALDNTFDNNCVGHDPSTIDVAPASAAADAQRAADVPHPAPVARAARRPRRSSRGSRCLAKRKIAHISFVRHTRRMDVQLI